MFYCCNLEDSNCGCDNCPNEACWYIEEIIEEIIEDPDTSIKYDDGTLSNKLVINL